MSGPGPIFFSADGDWGAPASDFPRGTCEIEALVVAALFALGDRWETLWEWNGLPHIYDRGSWQQRGRVERWAFRLCGDEPLLPGSYRLTVRRNGELVAQGDFRIRGPSPPSAGSFRLGELAPYQLHGRQLFPLARRGAPADALGASLGYDGLASGTPLHIIWRDQHGLLAVENRTWQGPPDGEEQLLYLPRRDEPLCSGLYTLSLCCWPSTCLERQLQL